jgi:hypothetical protein
MIADGRDSLARSPARTQGRTPCDDDKSRAILAHRDEGQSLREIARGVGSASR